jgi:hypothetical protein
MLPTYKMAEEYRQEAADKDEVIRNLELKLAEAKVSKTNGVGAAASGGDARYWKNKYESLLHSIDN